MGQHQFVAMSDTRRRCRGFFWPVLLALTAAAALGVDVPVALSFKDWNGMARVRDYLGYLDIFGLFGHGLGLALVLLTLHQLDPGRRWAIPRVMACALAAGGLADLLKVFIVRIRPHDIPLGFDGPVWATFELHRWLPLLSAGSGGQSFPSAHTALACGLAAALIWLYPHGRRLFTALAALVGCQRIACGAHYPSDVLLGAAIGCSVAMLLLRVGRLPAWFDCWERRWRERGHGAVQSILPD
jgi:membrane-associated phospholipid phosphatase